MLQKYFRFFSLHKHTFLLTVLAVGFFCLLTHFSNVGFTQNVTEADALQNNVQPSNITETEIPHTLVGSFYTVQNGINAKLLLNNKGIVPLEVRPTLYNLSGQSLELAPVWVEASSFRFINLQDWAAIGGESFRSGSIKLFHTGKDLVLGAQIYLTDETQSLSFEEKLAELGKFDSRRQEAVWFQPTNQTETQIVLSNTSTVPLSITARLSKHPQHAGDVNTFQLAAHETRILDLRQNFSDGQQFANANVVGLSLEYTGAKDALLARALIRDAGRGYSNLAQFSNPSGGKSSEYQGVGFQIDEIAGEQLTPVIVAKNVGSQTATVTAKVPYTRANGTTGTINLPPTTLQAGEMRTLNVQQIIQRAEQEQIKIGGLEITYNTVAGSIIVAAHSQSANGNQVFRVPMWDPMTQRSPTGGYPWRIEATSTTKTYIKNITDREQYYVAHLNWENGGEYLLGMKKVLPHQTIEIDIKQLRDTQTHDEAGRTIPLNATKGQLKWSLKQIVDVLPAEETRQALALIGRTEQIDAENGISSNYACQNCCADSYYDSYLTPVSVEVEVDAQVDFDVYQQDVNCYGELSGYYLRTPLNGFTSWGSSDTSVATVNDSIATATGAGDTTINANWTDYHHETGPCGPYFTDPPDEQCPAEIKQESAEQTKKDELPAPNIAPCGGCQNFRVYPRPSVILRVRPKITITRNGNPITVAQNVIVGEQMNLSATVTGGTVSNHQWSVPGNSNNRVANFEVTQNTGTVTDLTQFSNTNVQFYWVSGGDSRQVSYTATVRGRQYSKTATFNVKRPTVTVTSATHTTTIYTRAQHQELLFGQISFNSTDGIKFTRSDFQIPSGFSGDTIWVQTIDYAYTRTLNDGQTTQTASGIGLDSRFPYSANDPNAGSTADSPTVCLRICDDSTSKTKMQTRIDANMYLMFKPNNLPSGESAIYVPLRKVTWNWTAVATRRPDFLYDLTSASNSQNPSGADTTSFPQWTVLVTGNEPYQ